MSPPPKFFPPQKQRPLPPPPSNSTPPPPHHANNPTTTRETHPSTFYTYPRAAPPTHTERSALTSLFLHRAPPLPPPSFPPLPPPDRTARRRARHLRAVNGGPPYFGDHPSPSASASLGSRSACSTGVLVGGLLSVREGSNGTRQPPSSSRRTRSNASSVSSCVGISLERWSIPTHISFRHDAHDESGRPRVSAWHRRPYEQRARRAEPPTHHHHH